MEKPNDQSQGSTGRQAMRSPEGQFFTDGQMEALACLNGSPRSCEADSRLGARTDDTPADEGVYFLIVGGMGHLGISAIQPALAVMPHEVLADCLDNRKS
jgi:hypothetical protein